MHLQNKGAWGSRSNEMPMGSKGESKPAIEKNSRALWFTRETGKIL